MIFQLIDKSKGTTEWVNPVRVKQSNYVHLGRNGAELMERDGKEILEFYLQNNQVLQAHIGSSRALVETKMEICKHLKSAESRQNGYMVIRCDTITEREYYHL